MSKYPPNLIEKIINHEAFLIKIKRKSIIDQMVSTYIELVRKMWYYDMVTFEKYKDEKIPIESAIIEDAVKIIKEANESFNKIQIEYDLEIYYEDLVNIINDNYKIRSNIAPKPINRNEIYEAIEHHLLNNK